MCKSRHLLLLFVQLTSVLSLFFFASPIDVSPNLPHRAHLHREKQTLASRFKQAQGQITKIVGGVFGRAKDKRQLHQYQQASAQFTTGLLLS